MTRKCTIPNDLLLSIQELLDWRAAAEAVFDSGGEYKHWESIDQHAHEIVSEVARLAKLAPCPDQVEFIVKVELEQPDAVPAINDVLERHSQP